MISRRGFLHTTASAGIATAAAGGALAVEAAAAAAADPVSADAALAIRLDAILADLLAELREERRLSRLHEAAEATMPAWARPGPGHLLHDGTKNDTTYHWPEMAELPEPPTEAVGKVLIRPNFHDVWRGCRSALKPAMDFVKHADGSFSFTPPRPLTREERRDIQRREFAKVRAVVARRREQLALERAAGIPDIEAAMEAQAERAEAQRERLEEAAVGASPAALAATGLVEAMGSADDFAMLVLARTAPHLTGLLRLVVDDFVAKNETEGYYATILGTGNVGGLV